MAAYAIKPASGESTTDEQLAAFADAMEPAAAAAAADGRQDLAAFFALIAQINAAPETITEAQINDTVTQLAALGPEIQATCGVDMMQ